MLAYKITEALVVLLAAGRVAPQELLAYLAARARRGLVLAGKVVAVVAVHLRPRAELAVLVGKMVAAVVAVVV